MRRDRFAVTESLIEVSVAIATPPIRTAAKAIEYCTSFISTWSAPLLFFLPVSLNSRSQPLIRFCKSLRMVLAGTRTRLAWVPRFSVFIPGISVYIPTQKNCVMLGPGRPPCLGHSLHKHTREADLYTLHHSRGATTESRMEKE
jgi:hypothetical protein